MAASGPRAPVLTAAVSNRTVDLGGPDRLLLLLCFARETSDAAKAAGEAVRARWPLASQLLVGFCVNLQAIGRFLQPMARGVLESEYRAAAAALAPGQTPEDYVLILPDWNGEACLALGLQDVDKQAAFALIDPAGRVIGTGQGEDLASSALALVDTALAGWAPPPA